jgi:ubiquinone/menaquinone biosynthesis C-methylase UbiE
MLMLLAAAALAAEPPRYEFRKNHDPEGTGKFYMNREIAPVMGHQAAGWLERPEREKEENPTKLLDALQLKPGMTVADIGAGSGYHAFRMAKIVGDTGNVIAVDIQPEMLELINNRKKKEKIDNVEALLGGEKDPKLKPGTVDLMLLADVYHEFEFPYEMTEKMRDALKPGGRLAFVEFRLEDPAVPIKLVHKMAERQVVREMEQFPELEHLKTVKTLPWQHVIIFQKKAK